MPGSPHRVHAYPSLANGRKISGRWGKGQVGRVLMLPSCDVHGRDRGCQGPVKQDGLRVKAWDGGYAVHANLVSSSQCHRVQADFKAVRGGSGDSSGTRADRQLRPRAARGADRQLRPSQGSARECERCSSRPGGRVVGMSERARTEFRVKFVIYYPYLLVDRDICRPRATSHERNNNKEETSYSLYPTSERN